MNLSIKYRESFRPFAPSVLEEKTVEYFDLDTPSPIHAISRSGKGGNQGTAIKGRPRYYVRS